MTQTLTEAQLRALTNEELRRLQGELPPIINDAASPENRFREAIIAEGRRRGMW